MVGSVLKTELIDNTIPCMQVHTLPLEVGHKMSGIVATQMNKMLYYTSK